MSASPDPEMVTKEVNISTSLEVCCSVGRHVKMRTKLYILHATKAESGGKAQRSVALVKVTVLKMAHSQLPAIHQQSDMLRNVLERLQSNLLHVLQLALPAMTTFTTVL